MKINITIKGIDFEVSEDELDAMRTEVTSCEWREDAETIEEMSDEDFLESFEHHWGIDEFLQNWREYHAT